MFLIVGTCDATVGSSVRANYIHDSFGAGIMVFGYPDTNQLNANLSITHNVFVSDHGAIVFMAGVFVRCDNQSVPIFYDRDAGQCGGRPRPARFASRWTAANPTFIKLDACCDCTL